MEEVTGETYTSTTRIHEELRASYLRTQILVLAQVWILALPLPSSVTLCGCLSLSFLSKK